jgi:hypothetical protein
MASIYDVSFTGSVGTKIYVVDGRPNTVLPTQARADQFTAFKTWWETQSPLEIYNIVDGGTVGGTREIQSAATLRDGKLQKWPGTMDPGSMSITLGIVGADPGQQLVRKLANAIPPRLAAFRVEMPDETEAYFCGYVTGVPKEIGTASDYLSSAFTIEISVDVFQTSDLEEV